MRHRPGSRLAVLAAAVWTVSSAAASSAAGQVITGRVVEAETGDGLNSTLVEVRDSLDSPIGTDFTDREGGFRIALDAPGLFSVAAFSLTHGSVRVDSLSVAPEETLTLDDIVLEWTPIPLDPIVALGQGVTRGRQWVLQHQLLPEGRTFSGAMLEAVDPPSLTEHLATEVGLNVRWENGSDGWPVPTMRNAAARSMSPCVRVLVNRWPLGEASSWRSIDEIPLEWIAAIEVYNDVRAVPDGYAFDAEDCGLVNVWLWSSW